MTHSFVDIHCHLLPGIDDGPKSWAESLAMARLAVEDGITTIVATPHQLGAFGQNRGDEIRRLVVEMNDQLEREGIPLKVFAGGEVRIEPGLVEGLASGEVMSLGDHRRHVLVELPHDLYLPIDTLMAQLSARRIGTILAHPERNEGLLCQPERLRPLVDEGCLLQITAGSLVGILGADVQQMAEWMLSEGLVHFVSTDAHGPRSRRPLMRRAFDRVCELTDEQTAQDLCSRLPARVAAGRTVTTGRRAVATRRRISWWGRRASA